MGNFALQRVVMVAFALAGGVVLAAVPVTAQRREVPPTRESAQYSFAPIVKRAAPAVVNVYVRARVPTFVSPFADDPLFRRFFGERFGMPQERIQNSLGSGVIVAPEGVVVTNTHVVKIGGAAEIRIALADRREFDAKVVQLDDKSDIAVLRIEGGEGRFPYLEFENSDAIEVGDMVLAIGNPFGVGQTVTSGIISALGRTEVGNSDAQVFIQTDAAINPATPAERWLTWPPAWSASTRPSSPVPAARTALVLPFPPTWSGWWWTAPLPATSWSGRGSVPNSTR
ncbi:MAG TPA: trypsin-like peptidase domain-containing protein [Hyphomicrobiaceae bacterium]|nr:trypsin-like peptidase domain-containing protein [Hyphomicrobiaceae bacterium]